MPHKILGVDIGAYSVKVVVATAGFRSSAVTDFFEIQVPPGDEPYEDRAFAVLAEALRQHGLEHDVPYAAFPGDALSMRVIEFGFSGLKRADLEKAVGTELEGQLPHDLDELVYDFETLPAPAWRTPGVPDEAAAPEPAFVAGAAATAREKAPAPAAAAVGTRVLTAASTRERVTRFVRAAAARGVEPHALIAAPTVYARVAEKLAALGGHEGREDAVLVIDCGHARTNLCVVVRGRAVFARSISRGGRHITQAIARTWNLPFEDAERAKHADGFIASARERPTSAAWERISETIRPELTPLVRDLKQSLAACRAQTGMAPARAVLCGGGGRLRGLASYLSEELGLPIGQVTPDDAPRLVGPAAAARGVWGDAGLVAHGVALEGATGRPLFDLRKGELAYRADFSFLRAKAPFLAACALAIIAFAAVDAAAALFKLRKEEGILEKRLEQATTELFGKPMPLEEVRDIAAPKKEASPMPRMSAFDQLVEISRRLPARDQLRVDVQELEIKPQKITVKATADSINSVDEIEKRLKEIDCFTDIQRGKIQAGTGDEKQFSLTITTKCMDSKADKAEKAEKSDKGEKAEKGEN